MFKLKFGENTKVFGKKNVGLFAGGLEKRMNKAGFSGLYKLLDSYIKPRKFKFQGRKKLQHLLYFTYTAAARQWLQLPYNLIFRTAFPNEYPSFIGVLLFPNG